MRVTVALLLLMALAIVGPRSGLTQTSAEPDPQRARACHQAATEHQLAGDALKTFLVDCLGSKSAPAAKSVAAAEPCSARARQADHQKLKGEARRLFMSGCVKGT